MIRVQSQIMEMNLLEFLINKETNGFHPVAIETNIGIIDCRYYHSPKAQKAVIFVGGAGGDWESPAKRMFPRMAEEMKLKRTSSLRINYRHPADIEESVLDILAGITFLRSQGVSSVALVGHAFGAAVVLQAATISQHVSTVVSISTQTFGSEAVSNLYDVPLLLIHGSNDEVLPYQSSLFIHTLANDPKEILIYEQAGHYLNEVADDVYNKVDDWINKYIHPPMITNELMVS